MSDGIAAGRAAIEDALMPDRFVTSRGTRGPCGVTQGSGDGTPIVLHCRVDADIRPSDTIVVNGRTYTITESPPIHGMSLARHFTLVETARP